MNGSKVLPGGFSVFQEKAFTIALPALGVVFLLVAAFIYLNSRPKMVDWSIDHNNSSSRNNIINNSGKRREAQPVESSKTSSLHFWFFKVSCLKKIVSFFKFLFRFRVSRSFRIPGKMKKNWRLFLPAPKFWWIAAVIENIKFFAENDPQLVKNQLPLVLDENWLRIW